MTASSSSPRVLVFAPSAHLSSPAFGIAKARRLPEAQHAIRQALLAASLSSSGQQNGSSNGTNEVVLPSPEDLQAAHDDLAPILQADRAAHELTAKLFLPSMSLAPTSPAIIEDAISQLGRLLGETVWPETVVLAWPDVRYEGVETDFSGKKQRGLQSSSSSPRGGSPTNLTNGHTQEGCGSMKLASRAEAEADRLEEGESEVSEVELGRMVDFWTAIAPSPLLASTSLGITSFSLRLLRRFLAALPEGVRRPTINHLTLKDCCHIPQDLSSFAYEQGIRLISSEDPAEPIPSSALVDLFSGSSVHVSVVDWTLKYTLLHRSRGVVIDKGYILSASSATSQP